MHLSQVVANPQRRSVSVLSFPTRINGMERISPASHVGWSCDALAKSGGTSGPWGCRPVNFCFRLPRIFALSCRL